MCPHAANSGPNGNEGDPDYVPVLISMWTETCIFVIYAKEPVVHTPFQL